MHNRGWMFATLTLLMVFGFTVGYGTYVHLQTTADAKEEPVNITARASTTDQLIDTSATMLEAPDVITAELIEDLKSSFEETSHVYVSSRIHQATKTFRSAGPVPAQNNDM